MKLGNRDNEDGLVYKPKVLNSGTPSTDAVAIRVVSSSTEWEPAPWLAGKKLL